MAAGNGLCVVAYDLLLHLASRPPAHRVDDSSALVPILIALAVVAVVAVVGGLAFMAARSMDMRLHRGVSASRRRAIRKNGLRAQAMVIDVQFQSILGANDMILEVASPDGPYRVEVAEVLGLDRTECAFKGMTIAVFVDRTDRRGVVVDLDDMDRRLREKAAGAAEAHARLLRGG